MMSAAANDTVQMTAARPVNVISVRDIQPWLQAGVADIARRPLLSLGYGSLITVALIAAMALIVQFPLFVTGYLTGILLLGSFLATGFYAISRANAEQTPLGFWRVLTAWRQNPSGFGLFAVLLSLILIAWIRLTSLIVALKLVGFYPSYEALFSTMLTPGGLGLAGVLALAGAALATLCFMLSVVSLPMMASEQVSPIVAVVTSVQAVRANIWPMLVWAITIVILMMIGIVTVIGLLLILPLLGHASWHAYRRLATRQGD